MAITSFVIISFFLVTPLGQTEVDHIFKLTLSSFHYHSKVLSTRQVENQLKHVEEYLSTCEDDLTSS